ncbi:hypothetical protein A3765_17355 [Oleiphilus sp. HI0130]|uniref:glycosyltransferase n=2 Tax=Oleiphilus sp. HI0079 TaxID=1822254 RepID=UPI0007C31817|nr:glycosyltransferase [Oleiphilus sp. HI0079]KZZ11278.1 hypothetical protein A3750_06570 [Oleiphilus sp. HI0079]KZZ69548.1 hypothetical protein A3765_17355 [Oleiphilus sp. HI0130]
MKIAFFLGSTSYASGLYNATTDTAAAIRKMGHEVDYVFLEQSEALRESDKIVDIWGLSKKTRSSRVFIKLMKTLFGYHFFHALFSMLFSAKLETFLQKHDYDLVFFHGTNFLPFSAYSAPSYVVVHSCKYVNLVGRRRGIKKYFYHKLYQKIYSSKHLLCVSDSAKEDMLTLIKAKPQSIETIYNGFDFEKMKALAQQPCALELPEKFIMSAGRPDRTKRFDVLLRAFAESSSRETHDLVIFGEGRGLPELQGLAKELGIDHRVRFLGFYSPLNAVYQHASLYVLSSDIEGLPTVIVESIVAGTPVVSTDAGGARELLANGSADYVCEKGNHRELAKLIDRALEEDKPVSAEMLSFLQSDKVALHYISCAERQARNARYD